MPRSAAAEDETESKEAIRTIVVVTNRENPETTISKSELEGMFLKKRRFWRHGERCIPVDQTGSSEIRNRFYNAAVDRDPYQMQRYWMQETMTGNARPPVTLDNSATVKRYLQKIPGGIGYIYADEVDDTVNVLRVEGLEEFDPPEPDEAPSGKDETQP